MEMTFEQAMRLGRTTRPGMLHAFATRRGSGYMMRSEKRGGAYSSGPNRRPPKRKKAGFLYIFFTLLISLILWPVGMVMLWRRKVRLQAGTKLLISLLTLCLSVFLIVFALMVPVDNPEYTAFQDRANDWLDKAAVDVAAAGDAAYKKSGETLQIMSDFAEAGSDYSLVQTADALDKGVALAGDARTAIERLFRKGEAAPIVTEAPADATEAPKDTEAPEETGEPVVDVPAETDAPEPTDGAAPTLDLRLPEKAPDADSAEPLEAGKLNADGSFVPGTEEPDEPTEAPAEPTKAPAEATTKAPETPTEAPAEATDAAPTETDAAQPEASEATNTPEPAATEAAETEPAETDSVETEPAETEPSEAEPSEAPVVSLVKPAGEATVYYYEDGSKGFHRSATRHDMSNAPAHTLAEAFAAGKHSCNACNMPQESILSEEHIAWVDENNTLHTTDECASFTGDWRLIPLEQALDEGCKICPDCGADAYVESVYPAPTPTPEPEVVKPSVALKPAGELTVYFFDASVGYHVAPDCVGMSNAPAHTLAEAIAQGKHACGNCNPPAAALVELPVLWLDEKGICHTSDDCAAFSGSCTLITREDALEKGLEACPDCGAAEYLVPGTTLSAD